MEADDPLDFIDRDLQSLDEALRCPICGELYNTALTIKKCGHSFCSKCARDAMSTQSLDDRYCPACRTKLTGDPFEKAKQFNDIVRIWRECRGKIIELEQSKATASARSCTLEKAAEVADADSDDVFIVEQPRKRRNTSTDAQSSEIGGRRSSRRANVRQMYTCNDCGASCEETDAAIALHYSTCDPRSGAVQAEKSPEMPNDRKPLSKIWLSGMKDAQLRTKLAQYKLSTVGNRKQLEERWNLFLLIWNSACDEEHFTTDAGLRERLRVREQQLSAKPNMDAYKSEAQLRNHVAKYNDDFGALIAAARLSAKTTKQKPVEKEEETEDQ